MISVAEARQRVRAALPAPTAETIPLRQAPGRVLATRIEATFPQPRFTNAAMDGFAVRAADLAGARGDHPIVLPLAGIVAAGAREIPALNAGTCMQVMTGAPLPEGSDAVVMVERTSGFDSREVQFFEAPRPGQNIRPAGEEVRAGETVLLPGTRIGPAELGILATFGHASVPVFRRPRISILATGDELREPGETLGIGEIYNSNLHVLADLAVRAGADLVRADRVADDRARLEDAVRSALQDSDVIAFSGGISMGRFDHVREVVSALGVRDHFWKVAQRPGGPLFVGSRENSVLFGLPGNPVSSFTCFIEYVSPSLETMAGEAPSAPVRALLDEPFPREATKHRFLFGQAWLVSGRLHTAPSRKMGSHMLSSAVDANALLGAGPGEGPITPGNEIHVRLLPWARLEEDA